jgi:hypothetical protein
MQDESGIEKKLRRGRLLEVPGRDSIRYALGGRNPKDIIQFYQGEEQGGLRMKGLSAPSWAQTNGGQAAPLANIRIPGGSLQHLGLRKFRCSIAIATVFRFSFVTGSV